VLKRQRRPKEQKQRQVKRKHKIGVKIGKNQHIPNDEQCDRSQDIQDEPKRIEKVRRANKEAQARFFNNKYG
jgi:hypothetical protein